MFMHKTCLTVVGVCALCCALPAARGDTCPCPQQNKTVNYWVFTDGSRPVVDGDCATFDDCFLGYFIPAKGKTYTVIGADGKEVQKPFTWPTTHAWRGDYLHSARGPGDDENQWTWGLDIFGWVDKCCRIHLFSAGDAVHAWEAGGGVVPDPKGEEVQVSGDRRLPEHENDTPPWWRTIYLHTTPLAGIDGERVTDGQQIGTLTQSTIYDPHLHISIYDMNNSKTVDPVAAGLIAMKSHECKVPEPATSALLLAALGGLALRRLRGRA